MCKIDKEIDDFMSIHITFIDGRKTFPLQMTLVGHGLPFLRQKTLVSIQ